MPSIRELRRRKALTQEELAEELGVSLDTVSRWETGRCEPEAYHIRRLASFFGVNTEAIVLSFSNVEQMSN
jgi:transcriptional regulator with XRE-family HTH domain